MLLKRFYDDNLAQASYLVGCAATGEALIIDPNRDVGQYVSAAQTEGMRITHVTETHIHADFVSGSRELAARTGATLYLSGEGGADWSYRYAAERTVILRDTDAFSVGRIRIQALHTPGHTPEHLSFMVTDTAGADRPMGVFSGDFIFVGDVGRPDLLEKAAKVEGATALAAGALYASIQRFREQPDYLQLWPGHGAGSACGKALGAVPQSTLGYERFANWAFRVTDEKEFVRTVVAGQPEPPKYFAQMKRINRDGPDPRPTGVPAKMSVQEVQHRLQAGGLVVDTRRTAAFAAGHIPGTINIPFSRSFTTYAGWLVPYDRDFALIVDDEAPRAIDVVSRNLAMIGLDRITGYAAADILDAWRAGGNTLETVRQVTSAEVADQLGKDVNVIDVRWRDEWEGGHIPNVPNLPMGHILDHLDEVPKDGPLVVHCEAGSRGAIVASLLKARGWSDVRNMPGGYAEWARSGLPVEPAPRSPPGKVK